MGEYIKHGREEVKIGTMESLYYVSFDKYKKAFDAGVLSKLVGNAEPADYLNPKYGFRFRFPFPDEDKLRFGDIIGSYDRGLPIKIDCREIPFANNLPGVSGHYYELEITAQKFVNRQSDGKLCLALVCRNPLTKQIFRLEDEADIKPILQQILQNHIIKETNPEVKDFYRQIIVRIRQGYRIGAPEKNLNVNGDKPQKVQKRKSSGKKM